MEENNINKKGNIYPIMLFLVLVVLIGAVYGITAFTNEENKDKEEKIKSTATPTLTNITSDENIVRTEIEKLIKYLNREVAGSPNENPCYIKFYYNNFEEGKDIFSDLNVAIYSCIHDIKLDRVEDNPFGESVLLSKAQYDNYSKYFYEKLDIYTVDKVYNDDIYTNSETVKTYLDGNYYQGYVLGSGFDEPATAQKYELKNITKLDDDTFKIEMTAKAKMPVENANGLTTHENSYTEFNGTFTVKVIDNYLKYSPLIFEKVK